MTIGRFRNIARCSSWLNECLTELPALWLIGVMKLGQRVQAWYQTKVVERSLGGQFLRKFRRFYLGTFKPEVIEKSVAETRKGDCHRCGLCCELIYRCPFLGKDSENLPYCRIYGDLRPANCRNYPFDATDSEIDQCGYTFKDLKTPEPVEG